MNIQRIEKVYCDPGKSSLCNNEKVTDFPLVTELNSVRGFWETIWKTLWTKIWSAIFDALKEIWDKWRNSTETGSCYQLWAKTYFFPKNPICKPIIWLVLISATKKKKLIT